MSYTKGPWKLSQLLSPVYGSDGSLVDKRIPIYSDSSSFQIAHVVNRGTENAHLIAAAPELLEALKNLMGLWYREDVADTWNDEFMKAQTAISKAEGKD